MFKKFLKKSEEGMTLIEIMVVIAIIGLIATTAIVNIMKQFERAKVKTTKTQVKGFEQALEQYYLDNGNYPTSEQGLKALEQGEYIKKVPKDPWSRDYNYVSPGQSGSPYDISSGGPDKQEGTEDDIKSGEE